MRILAIDPGPEESASVLLVDGVPMYPNKCPNADVLNVLRSYPDTFHLPLLAVEMIASYGMAVGREVFETCLCIGRFIEAWSSAGGEYRLVYRRDVKLHICHSARATDSNIRTELIDLYGGSKEKAIGKKASQGPLYALKGDMWSALAVALTAQAQEETNGIQAASQKSIVNAGDRTTD